MSTDHKKHGEEILMKLQENEARKKAESSHLKRTRELDCTFVNPWVLQGCKEEKQRLEEKISGMQTI